MSFEIVNITKTELQYAKSNGEVYGVIKRGGKTQCPVYVELGKERDYTPKVSDDPNTQYKFFSGCTVFYGKTEEDLAEGIYIMVSTNVSVKLCF